MVKKCHRLRCLNSDLKEEKLLAGKSEGGQEGWEKNVQGTGDSVVNTLRKNLSDLRNGRERARVAGVRPEKSRQGLIVPEAWENT